MEAQSRHPPLVHVEEAAAEASERQHRRRLHAALITTVAVAFACVARITHAPVATAIAVVWAVLAAGSWLWVARHHRGQDGRLARAWGAWLRAMSWYEVSQALVLTFREHHPVHDTSVEAEVAQRSLDQLMETILVKPIERDDVVVAAIAELLRTELGERVAAIHARETLTAANRLAQSIRDEAAKERERVLTEALQDADDLRHGRVPRHSPWLVQTGSPVSPLDDVPREPPELREKVLRTLFQQAATEAERGVVMESPAAADVLRNPGRWSAYVAPRHAVDALLALFDPTCAVDVPPPERRDPPTG